MIAYEEETENGKVDMEGEKIVEEKGVEEESGEGEEIIEDGVEEGEDNT